jgi:hypothetical protein
MLIMAGMGGQEKRDRGQPRRDSILKEVREI